MELTVRTFKTMTRSILTLIVTHFFLVFLYGCTQGSIAPVYDRSSPSYSSLPLKYEVASGDTLYGIAFRYGFDYRELARANEIEEPYTIFPGQVLSFNKVRPASEKATSDPIIESEKIPLKKNDSGSDSSTPASVTTKSKIPIKSVSEDKVSRWLWPADGEILRKFSASLHKGIDISGKEGDSVIATADGRVVYAGIGISGFGKLLIIKHNEKYLSAYGHNASLLVKENALVSAGQVIARKGSSGTDKVKLHFEIRREGKPMDPLDFLPRR